MKVSELTGAALDWAVAKCEGQPEETLDPLTWECTAYPSGCYNYSTDWAQGGPIIEREKIELKYLGYDNPPYWGALKFSPSKYERKAAIGPSPLIAAMRCFVASRFGDEVEVPPELK